MYTRLPGVPITRTPDYTVDTKEYYARHVTSPEDAVSVVKSGDHVAICRGREPEALGLALVARKDELQSVKVTIPQPGRDNGMFDVASWSENFQLQVGFVTNLARSGVDEGFIEYRVNMDMAESAPGLGLNPSYGSDVYMVEISPPDDHGFCSFGASVWDKAMAIKTAKKVLAEVNPRMIRTYGENFVHVSEIDAFVENEAPTGWTISRTKKSDIPELAKRFAEIIGTLVKSGDTIQLGLGQVTEWLPRAGAFDDHVDLGLYTEITPRGTTALIEGGVITNKRKTLHPGKCIATAAGGSRDDVGFINENPLFELYNVDYVINPLTAAKNDNFVAINSGLMMDLSGQGTAESFGAFQWSGPGGQPVMALGALMAKNGRSIICLPSTSSDGKHSRIVPLMPEGTAVTVPRYMTDIVVTEYGVAHLRWKTLRERAQELIKVAHPDFRAELEKAARSQFWPH